MASILLAEDDDAFRGVLATGLRKQGYDVIEAQDGTDASVQLARGFFEVIVTDMYMPGKDGFELMAEIRRAYASSKIIVISGGGRAPTMNIFQSRKISWSSWSASQALQTFGTPGDNIERIATIRAAVTGLS